jgi:hypothetical protein
MLEVSDAKYIQHQELKKNILAGHADYVPATVEYVNRLFAFIEEKY